MSSEPERRRYYETQADLPEPTEITVDVAVRPMRLIEAPNVRTGAMCLYAEPFPECGEIMLTATGLVGPGEHGEIHAEIVSTYYEDGARVHGDALQDWDETIRAALLEEYKRRFPA